jgi:hypothetical protein
MMKFRGDIAKSSTRVVEGRSCLRKGLHTRRGADLALNGADPQALVTYCRLHPGERSDHVARAQDTLNVDMDLEVDEPWRGLSLSRLSSNSPAVTCPGVRWMAYGFIFDLATEILLSF